METERERQLKEEIQSKESQLTFIKEQLEDEQRRGKMKSSLLTKVDLLSQLDDSEIIELGRRVKLRDVIIMLKAAELLTGDLLFDPSIIGLSIAEAGCLMSKNKPTKDTENIEI